MARAIGLMNPANAVKSAGIFKEGIIRIDSNSYKVHKGQAGEGQPDAVPATKWSWKVTRLQEDGVSPLLDENDEEIHEELLFNFGGKCLPFVHPGHADNPNDDAEDLETAIGAEGNTVYLNAPDWRANERSGLMVLTASLAKLGVKEEYLNRCWTPDWNGCVFEMKTQEGGKGNDGRVFTYKIVSRILQGPGGKKATGKNMNGPVPNDAANILAPIINKLSMELAGQTLTRKAFVNRVKGQCDAANVPSNMMIPVLTLVKDDKWLTQHQETFDYTISSDGIVFGDSGPTAA
jgi:hypothetical protein